MLNIKHFPTLDTEAALEHYKSEGAKYVCTTELKAYGIPVDVFTALRLTLFTVIGILVFIEMISPILSIFVMLMW